MLIVFYLRLLYLRFILLKTRDLESYEVRVDDVYDQNCMRTYLFFFIYNN